MDRKCKQSDDCNSRIGTLGHLNKEVKDEIFYRFEKRDRNRGIVSLLATEYSVSEASISNIILKKTGKRPSLHKCPTNDF